VHLRELNLGLGADSLREGCVSDNVAQCLSVSALVISRCLHEEVGRKPFRLVFREDLPLGVVANVADINITSNIELGCAELRHDGGGCGCSGAFAKCR
jgi:hypothetical protein